MNLYMELSPVSVEQRYQRIQWIFTRITGRYSSILGASGQLLNVFAVLDSTVNYGPVTCFENTQRSQGSGGDGNVAGPGLME